VVTGGWHGGFDDVATAIVAGCGGAVLRIPGAGHRPHAAGSPFNEAVAAFWAASEPSASLGLEAIR
jgi:hypothetical protein